MVKAKQNTKSVFKSIIQSEEASKDQIIEDLRSKIDLLKQKVGSTDSASIDEVSLDLVESSPYQCRIYFNEWEQEQLTESIREFGVITPSIVRMVNNRYELIAGHRRCISSKAAGLTTVPIRVLHNISDQQAAKLVLIENLKRSDISPIEEVRSVISLILRTTLHGYDNTEKIASDLKKIRVIVSGKSKQSITSEQEELFQVGKELVETVTNHKWESFLANRLSLIDLPTFLQEMVIRGLEYTKAKLLAKITKALGDEEGERIAQQAFDEKLSLSEIRKFLPGKNILKDGQAESKEQVSYDNQSQSYELIATQLKDIQSYWNDGLSLSPEELTSIYDLLDLMKADIEKSRRITLCVSDED